MQLPLMLPVLATSLLLAAGQPKEDAAAKDERAKLQGAWEVVKLVHDGIEVAEAAVQKMEVTIKDDKLTRKDDDEADVFTFTLQPGKKPKTIDLTPTAEERKDRKIQGIYELDGDALKICIAEPNKARPTKFDSPAESDWELLVLKRKKP